MKIKSVVGKPFLQRNHGTIRQVVMALAEAIQLVKANRELGQRYLAEMMRLDLNRTDHREAVAETYQAYTGVMEQLPLVDLDGVRTLVQALSLRDPGWRELPPERLGVDTGVVKELEQSGFFQRLSASVEKTGR